MKFTLKALFLLSLLVPSAHAARAQESAEDLLRRGREKAASKDLEGALSDFGRAVELKPDFAEAFGGRAHVLAKQGKYRPALADLDRAVAVAPSSTQALHARASLRLSRGEDAEGAIADLDRLAA